MTITTMTITQQRQKLISMTREVRNTHNNNNNNNKNDDDKNNDKH